jgi:hypothetical protein
LLLIHATSSAQVFQRGNRPGDGFVKDQGYFSLYVTVLGVGYNGWVYNFEDETGTHTGNLTARGQGIVTGPHIIATYTFSILSLGIETGYDFIFMRDMDEEFIPANIRDLDDTQRQLYKIAGKVMYDVLPNRRMGIHPNIAVGTFWLTRDDFDEDTQNRLYGKLGLLLDLPLTPYIKVFAEPHYAIFNYNVGNVDGNPSTSMNAFQVNLGIGLRL